MQFPFIESGSKCLSTVCNCCMCLHLLHDTSVCFSLQDLNKVAFRFKDKERPRGYTSKVAGLLHVRPLSICKGCFQGDAVRLIVSAPAVVIRPHWCFCWLCIQSTENLQRHSQKLGCMYRSSRSFTASLVELTPNIHSLKFSGFHRSIKLLIGN